MIQNKESSCCDSHSCGFHSNNFPPAFLSALHYNHLQKMWRLTIGAISFLIILVSIPGNLTIVHYLNEKPPGHQTTVDSVFKDFFLINFTSTLLNGLRYCFLLLITHVATTFFPFQYYILVLFWKADWNYRNRYCLDLPLLQFVNLHFWDFGNFLPILIHL